MVTRSQSRQPNDAITVRMGDEGKATSRRHTLAALLFVQQWAGEALLISRELLPKDFKHQHD